MLENSPEHIFLVYAMILSGIVWVPVNTRFRHASIKYVIEHSGASLIVADAQYLPEISKCSTSAKTFTLDDYAQITSVKDETAVAPVQPHDTLCIIYTSGTTGAPKGVMFTHRMLRLAGEAACIVARIEDGDRLLLWEPLCHIGGAQMLIVPFIANASLYITKRFSARRFWQQVADGNCTHLHYLGGVLDILLQRGGVPDSHSLKVAWGAGIPASRWQTAKQALGVNLRECYGMTECASFATANINDVPGSIGKALPWMEISLLDDSGNPVPVGQVGQIVISSKIEGNFLSGYLDNEAATAQALKNGMLYTGDIARADTDGNLYFVGRLTDSIRVKGENVSAWEVERVFQAHPDVHSVAAIGVDSSIGEKDILLYVQWREGASTTLSDLNEWASSDLAGFQLPRFYKEVSNFERTPSERIRKHLLLTCTSGAWERV